MIIIGELINSTRKEVQQALQTRDEDTIRHLACRQSDSGAQAIGLDAR